MKLKQTILTTLMLFTMGTQAFEIATTSDGRQFKLNNNGTYTLIESSNSAYERIDFIRLHLDASDFEGKKVTLKGYAGFDPLRSENKTPVGSISEKPHDMYNQYLVTTKSLDRTEIAKVGKCNSECLVELSGVVYRPHAHRPDLYYIEAHRIRILKGPDR